MKLFAAIAVILLSSSLVSTAFSQTDRQSGLPAAKEITFDDGCVHRLVPEKEDCDPPPPPIRGRESLIRVRDSFSDKVMPSANRL